VSDDTELVEVASDSVTSTPTDCAEGVDGTALAVEVVLDDAAAATVKLIVPVIL
jgi:hypothetical protein